MRAVISRWAPLLLVFMAACADSREDHLERARSMWRAAGIADYSFRYRTTGFAPRVDIRVTVESGEVTRVERLGGALDVAVEGAPTIDSLFDDIARALRDGLVDVRVDYDAGVGAPVSASFAGGQEVYGFEIGELAVS